VNYFEDPVDVAIRARANRRDRIVRSIRGWLREERRPRLTAVALLGVCALFAIGAGYGLARCGLRSWGLRAFWSVVIVWPIFLVLFRWRVAVEYQRFTLGDRTDYFIAKDDLVERELSFGWSETQKSETWAHALNGAAREIGKGCGRNPLLFILVAGLTLGTWAIWDMSRHHATLLAETLVDAELVNGRLDLLTSIEYRDWRTEAAGVTAFYFAGLALGAGLVGWVLPYLHP
jgi:hypothetical protein